MDSTVQRAIIFCWYQGSVKKTILSYFCLLVKKDKQRQDG